MQAEILRNFSLNDIASLQKDSRDLTCNIDATILKVANKQINKHLESKNRRLIADTNSSVNSLQVNTPNRPKIVNEASDDLVEIHENNIENSNRKISELPPAIKKTKTVVLDKTG